MYQINSFENLFDPCHFKKANSQKNLDLCNYELCNFKPCNFKLCNFNSVILNFVISSFATLPKKKRACSYKRKEKKWFFALFFTFLHQFVTNRLQNLTTPFPSLNVGKGRENLRGRKEK
jgi:hypothetical protein